MFPLSTGEVKMKPLFDVQKSLQLCPPKFRAGVKHIKRIVLKRGEDVTYPKENNPRLLNIVAEKIPEIRDSFIVNGFIHSCNPPTVKVDPNNKNRFIGLSGYHRNVAAEQADWETMIYDVVQFDSPKDERIHRLTTNHVFTPAIANTLDDLVKQVKEAICSNEITNEDSDIKDFIKIVAADKTEKNQNTIFNRVRRHVSTSSTLLCYHAGKGENSTSEIAQKFNLPLKGDLRFSQSKKLGYISSQETPRGSLYEGKILSREYGGVPVEFYAWISSPLEAPKLHKQRLKYKETFDRFLMEDCETLKYEMEKLGFKVKLEDIIKNHPVRFVGFLPQDISPNPLDGGKPKEQGIVDVYGNPVLI